MNSFSHLDEHGQAHMVDVGAKAITRRIATAEATLHCSPDTILQLKSKALPKGDVLAVARIAGIQAAKKTDDLIPLCHSLPIDQVTVDFEIHNDHIRILTAARTTAKTGIEMEALTAASIAALTLYDMMKAVDKSMSIDTIRVVSKEKSPIHPVTTPPSTTPLKVGRVTLSDRASAGVYVDKSGPEIERVFGEIWRAPCEFIPELLPDDPAQIADALRRLSDEAGCHLIITTGGTGPGARDVTPEATLSVLEKELHGLGEAMRAVSFHHVPTAILSRATAGTRGRTLIINLPGNPKAIAECLPPILPAIRECLMHLQDQAVSPA